MKQTSKKLLLLTILILCMAVLVSSLCACTDAQRKKAVETYGMGNAYMKNDNGKTEHLRSGRTVTYYIPTGISGDYRAISEYALAKANTLTSSITINGNGTTETFRFSVENGNIEKHENANAVNFMWVSESTGEVTRSNITYSKAHMDGKTLASKKHTALHEMGHTFGLGHIEADVMKGYTVIMSPHPESKYELDDFAEFDRYNITWYYGE